MCRFYLYAKRHSSDEVTVRVLCLTEPDRALHPLEVQEEFEQICQSEDVEIFDKTDIGVKFSGNLLLSEDQPHATFHNNASEEVTAPDSAALLGRQVSQLLHFRAFSENRQAFTLKRRNDKNPYPKGKITFFSGVERVLFEPKIDLTKFLKNKPGQH